MCRGSLGWHSEGMSAVHWDVWPDVAQPGMVGHAVAHVALVEGGRAQRRVCHADTLYSSAPQLCHSMLMGMDTLAWYMRFAQRYLDWVA